MSVPILRPRLSSCVDGVALRSPDRSTSISLVQRVPCYGVTSRKAVAISNAFFLPPIRPYPPHRYVSKYIALAYILIKRKLHIGRPEHETFTVVGTNVIS
jgi:hypothetical protein